jgi:hypothetical protein
VKEMRRCGSEFSATRRSFVAFKREQNSSGACITGGAPFVGSQDEAWWAHSAAAPRNFPGVSRMKSFCLTFLVLLILFFIMTLACGGK